VSIVGGLLHNLGQLLVAVFILDSPSLFYYLVILWLVGSFSGALIGVIGALIVDRVGVLPNDKNSRA
ncbi:MAG: Gx transporter family protein, partial [Eubacterium sp.]|nr:Gx transporter family protein [Eubacterium sp.]